MRIYAEFHLYSGVNDLTDSFNIKIDSIEEYQNFVKKIIDMALEGKDNNNV